MRIPGRLKRRRGIHPILATVILIAITLIAATALAGFVFGLFGTFTSSHNVRVEAVACASGTGTPRLGTATGVPDSCLLAVTNTGGSSASVTGCSLYGTPETSGPPGGTAQATVAVPAGTTSGSPVIVQCSGYALMAGAQISGQLVVASGSPLAFSAVAS